MKWILLGLLLSSCSLLEQPKLTYREKVMQCIDRYLDAGIQFEQASSMCYKLYGRKK